MQADFSFYLVGPGPRPAFGQLAQHLWGTEANLDSDGDSASPEDVQWTELSLRVRDGTSGAEVHVDAVSTEPLILQIQSPDGTVARKAAEFLREHSGGVLQPHRPQM